MSCEPSDKQNCSILKPTVSFNNKRLLNYTIKILTRLDLLVKKHINISSELLARQKIEQNPYNIFQMGIICSELYKNLELLYGLSYHNATTLIQLSIQRYDWKALLVTISEIKANLSAQIINL